MTDRLEGIKSRYEKPPTVWDSSVQEDVRYLVAKVEALESELAYLRDHPGWIPPIPPDEAERFKSFIEKQLERAALRAGPPGGEPPKVAEARREFWGAVERVKSGTDEPGLLEMCADNLIRALSGGAATP